jgi:aminoglycoside phosphotransferase (APT) family kinase protein
MQMHADQLAVSRETAAELINTQFPQWRGLPVSQVASQGTVNAIFRIGERFTARFPLQPEDVEQARRGLEREAQAALELLGRTRFPTPEPIGIGEPGLGYPMPWSVQTWIPGIVAIDQDPGESVAFAHDLVEFISAVRAIDTRGRTFRGGGRGGQLQTHDKWMETCFRQSEALLDVARLRRMWAAMRDLPRGESPDVMTHGDLMPGNVLVSNTRLAGVLDVGGLGPADPANDVLAAWHLLEARPRQAFRDELGCDDLEWERGKAWAFQQAMGAIWYYHRTNPVMSQTCRRTLARILADGSGA